MLKNYLKVALKGLMRRKYYTIVSLFGIVITLAVLTVSVAMLNHMSSLGKPGSKLDRCLIANRIEAIFKMGHIISSPSYNLLKKYIANLKSPEAVSLFSGPEQLVGYMDDKRIPLTMEHTDDIFWDIVEFRFLEGKPYNKEALDRADKVAVITDRAVQQVFGTKPALGEYFETSNGTYRIIGVIPFKEIGAMTLNADLYVPITTSLSDINNEELWGDGRALVLAADKSQFPIIKNEFKGHVDQIIKDNNEKYEIASLDCFLGSMGEAVAKDINQSEIIYVLGIVGVMVLFMLLPAINLTTINISRIMERFPEIGIRKAFGASALTLMGQFIIENIILTLIGGVIAYIIAWITLIYINSSGVVPWGHIELDTKVFFYSLIVTIFFGIFSGILPSFRMSRVHPAEALKGIRR
jgi:putative ABC transport system permease protein